MNIKKYKSIVVSSIIAITMFLSGAYLAHAQLIDYDPKINPSAKTCVFLAKNLRLGMKSSEVYNLQAYLYAQKYSTLKPTGYFGQKTLSAVKNFQREQGLGTTGFVGNYTRAKIEELTCHVKNPETTISSDKVLYKNDDLGFGLYLPSDVKQVSQEVFNNSSVTSFSGKDINFSVQRYINSNIPFNEFNYRDRSPSGTAVVRSNNALIFKSDSGYCDSGGCSRQYIAYVFHKKMNYYVIVFYGDTVLSEKESSILSTIFFDDITFGSKNTESDAQYPTSINKLPQPSISVISPYSNQEFYNDDIVTLQWSSQNIPSNEVIKIFLINNGVAYTIGLTENTGIFQFIPENIKGWSYVPGVYSIRMTSQDTQFLTEISNLTFKNKKSLPATINATVSVEKKASEYNGDQVNKISFTGGTFENPIKKWGITFRCYSSFTHITMVMSEGDLCSNVEHTFGVGGNNGNIWDQHIYISSYAKDSIKAEITAYGNDNFVIGKKSIDIPIE